MKQRLAWLAFALVASLSAHAFAQESPVGTWRTIDDNTGRERSTVKIEQDGAVLSGHVVSVLDPNDAAKVCSKCSDDRKGKPLIGLEIIRSMRQNGREWDGGRVLDPETGSIYQGEMHTEDGGKKLVLRGYIGISLFGRSQTWLRAAP